MGFYAVDFFYSHCSLHLRGVYSFVFCVAGALRGRTGLQSMLKRSSIGTMSINSSDHYVMIMRGWSGLYLAEVVGLYHRPRHCRACGLTACRFGLRITAKHAGSSLSSGPGCRDLKKGP